MDKKKWVAYGVTGAVGIGILAGGAVTAAQAMDLRSLDGQTIPGGALTGTTTSLVTDAPAPASPSATPVPTASPTGPSPVTPATAATAPTPSTPPSPVTSPSPVSPPSPVTPASPVSVVSSPSN